MMGTSGGGAGLGLGSSSLSTEISGGLDKNNIGFQMMKKLGKFIFLFIYNFHFIIIIINMY